MSDYLDDVWDNATAWLSEQPKAWSREDAAEEARARANALLLLVEDPTCPLLDADRAVLAYACARAVDLRLTRVALPYRSVVSEAGVGARSAKKALVRLDAAGLLRLVEAGVAAGPSSKKRPKANLYELGDSARVQAYMYRGTRSVGPAARDCETPGRTSTGTPTQDCGTPSDIGRTVSAPGTRAGARADGVVGHRRCDPAAGPRTLSRRSSSRRPGRTRPPQRRR
ncbi:MAG: hypothetical protein JWP11_140 [Frankiales bacterium]|nr:hypothetical protein [Frankiales bacterium]